MLRNLPVTVHFIIVFLVVPTGDIVHPFLVVEVPSYGLFDAFLELEARLPAQLFLELRAVDGVSHVVPGTVRDVCYQSETAALRIA